METPERNNRNQNKNLTDERRNEEEENNKLELENERSPAGFGAQEHTRTLTCRVEGGLVRFGRTLT